MPLISLQKSKSITEFLFWVSLVVILFAFFNALWDIFFVFLIAASLIFLDYFILQQYIKRKGQQIEKKAETKANPVKKRITTIYAALFLIFMATFLFSHNLFWVLLMFLTLAGYHIAKRQPKVSLDKGAGKSKEKAEEKVKGESKENGKKKEEAEKRPSFFKRLFTKRQPTPEEIKQKEAPEKKSTVKKQPVKEKEIIEKRPSFFSRLFTKRQLTSEEIKQKELLAKKIREIKAANKKARVEKLKERKRLEEITKKINAERKKREMELKASMREKKLKNKIGVKMGLQLEKEKKTLDKLKAEKKKIMDKEAKLEKFKKGGAEMDSTGTAEESVMDLKDRYETDLDKLVNLVNRYDVLKLSEVAEIFKIDVKIAEEWANILEQHNLLIIHYPAIGEAELMKAKGNKKIK